MLEQENSSRSSPASRGHVKQVSSWLFFPAPARQELSLGSLQLPGCPEEQISSTAGDRGTGRTALLSRLDSRARQGPHQPNPLVDVNIKMYFSGHEKSDIATKNKKIVLFIK